MSLCLLIFLYRIIFHLICNIRRAKTSKHLIHNNFHQTQKCKETVKLYTFCKVLYSFRTEIRGKKVMLDFDLARLYQVETKALNQAVKRNLKRFPPDFMFQLTVDEFLSMRSRFVTASKRNTSTPPFAFTEQGVAMLSGLLKSDVAIAANIAIMRAFVQVREYLLAASSVSSELKELRAKVDLLASREDEDRGNIDTLYKAIGELAARLEERKNEPRPRIGFK